MLRPFTVVRQQGDTLEEFTVMATFPSGAVKSLIREHYAQYAGPCERVVWRETEKGLEAGIEYLTNKVHWTANFYRVAPRRASSTNT